MWALKSYKYNFFALVVLDLAIFIFIILLVFSTSLRSLDLIGPSEYVALIGIFILASILIHYKKDISEFSIVGNTVRLNKSTEEAKEAIKELKDLRIDTFRLLLDVNLKTGGGAYYHAHLVEYRAKEFFNIFNKIQQSGHLNELLFDVSKSADKIFTEQLKGLKNHMKSRIDVINSYGDMPKPTYISFLVDSVVEENVNTKSSDFATIEKVRHQFFLAIDNYTQIYCIKKKIDEMKMS